MEKEQIDEYRQELLAMVPTIVAGMVAHPDHPTGTRYSLAEVNFSDADVVTRAIRVATQIIGGVAIEANNPGDISGDGDPDSTILNRARSLNSVAVEKGKNE